MWEGSLHTALPYQLCDRRQASEGPETPRWLLSVPLRRIHVFFVAAASRLLPVIIGGCFSCHCSDSVLQLGLELGKPTLFMPCLRVQRGSLLSAPRASSTLLPKSTVFVEPLIFLVHFLKVFISGPILVSLSLRRTHI